MKFSKTMRDNDIDKNLNNTIATVEKNIPKNYYTFGTMAKKTREE